MFGSDIQDGLGGHLKTLQTISSLKPYVRLNRNLMGGIWGQHGDSELLKLFHSYFQDGQPGSHLENFKNIFSRTIWEALRHNGDSELPKLFYSNIQDGRHGSYSKTCVKGPLKNRQNKDLNDKW